jgi:hypothetical protein
MTAFALNYVPSTRRETPEEKIAKREVKLRRWLEMRAEGVPSQEAARILGTQLGDLTWWRKHGVNSTRPSGKRKAVTP